MKLIGITQRIDFVEGYGEQRDALDRKWSDFLLECELIPIILPNNIKIVRKIMHKIKLDGFIFTGGNNLFKYGGEAEARDEIELFCIEYAMSNKLPLIGICRGMQFIQDYFGVKLNSVSNHVATHHDIINCQQKYKVNSYHTLGSKSTVEELSVIAYSEDNIVEAIKHVKYDIYGIMWHPERVRPFNKLDEEFFKNVFGNQCIERRDNREGYNFSSW